MDLEYLKETVGDALREGLTKLALQQPADPVDHLAQFLLKYADKMERQAKIEMFKKAKEDGEPEEKDAEEPVAVEAKKVTEAQRRMDEAEAELNAAENPDAAYEVAIRVAMEFTGASSCYFARKVPARDDDAGYTSFVAASDDHKFLLTEVLPEDAGVIKDAWNPPEEEEEGEPKPAYIHIPNVMRDERLHFFRQPKLGAFAVFPFEYKTCFHPAAVGDDGAIAEGDERTVPVKMALCADTLGQARPFTKSQLVFLQKWSVILGGVLERVEPPLLEAEAASLQEDLANFGNMSKAFTQQLTVEEKEEDDTPNYIKNWVIANARRTLLLEHFKAAEEKVKGIISSKIEPKPDVLRAMQCGLYFLGFTPVEVCGEGRDKPVWVKIKKIVAGGVKDRLLAFDPAAPIKIGRGGFNKPESLQSLAEGLASDEIKAKFPLAGILLDYALSAGSCREAYAAKIAGEEEAKKAEAEAKEEEEPAEE